MENKKQPAFPFQWVNQREGSTEIEPGLTKREYFAGIAFQAMLANPELLRAVTSWDIAMGNAKEKVAIKSIEYADALLNKLEIE